MEVDVQDLSQIRVVSARLGGNSVFNKDSTGIACLRPNSFSNYILAIYEDAYVKMVEIEFFQEEDDIMVKVVGARYKPPDANFVHDGSTGR